MRVRFFVPMLLALVACRPAPLVIGVADASVDVCACAPGWVCCEGQLVCAKTEALCPRPGPLVPPPPLSGDAGLNGIFETALSEPFELDAPVQLPDNSVAGVAAAYQEGQYLVAWVSGMGFQAVRARPDGSIIDPVPFELAPASLVPGVALGSPAIDWATRVTAADGGGFSVGWTGPVYVVNTTIPYTGLYRLYSVSVSASGAVGPVQQEGFQRWSESFEAGPFRGVTLPEGVGAITESTDEARVWRRADWAMTHVPFEKLEGHATLAQVADRVLVGAVTRAANARTLEVRMLAKTFDWSAEVTDPGELVFSRVLAAGFDDAGPVLTAVDRQVVVAWRDHSAEGLQLKAAVLTLTDDHLTASADVVLATDLKGYANSPLQVFGAGPKVLLSVRQVMTALEDAPLSVLFDPQTLTAEPMLKGPILPDWETPMLRGYAHSGEGRGLAVVGFENWVNRYSMLWPLDERSAPDIGAPVNQLLGQTNAERDPVVACDETTCLAAWVDTPASARNATHRGLRFSTRGEPRDDQSFELIVGSPDRYDIASTPNGFVVAAGRCREETKMELAVRVVPAVGKPRDVQLIPIEAECHAWADLRVVATPAGAMIIGLSAERFGPLLYVDLSQGSVTGFSHLVVLDLDDPTKDRWLHSYLVPSRVTHLPGEPSPSLVVHGPENGAWAITAQPLDADGEPGAKRTLAETHKEIASYEIVSYPTGVGLLTLETAIGQNPQLVLRTWAPASQTATRSVISENVNASSAAPYALVRARENTWLTLSASFGGQAGNTWFIGARRPRIVGRFAYEARPATP